jgi:pimeloyl-ACP methyl ester carboxylesterase
VRFVSTAEVDWTKADSVIEYFVGYSRVLAGSKRAFDEAAARELIRRDVRRARNFSSLQNHNFLSDDGRVHEPLSSITAPTVVIHGTADPMFPLPHGEALSAEIPGAELLTLEGAGHGIDPIDWESIVRAIVHLTSR